MISVIIPTFNSSNTLKNCLDSLVNQTYKNFEVILIDNYSTDRTKYIIEEYRAKLNINFFELKNNNIIAKSRNLGINKSSSEWIAFLDSDDSWHKNKLLYCNNILNEGVDVVYHDVEILEAGKKNKLIKIGKLKKPIIKDLLKRGNILYNSSLIIRKKILDTVGFIDESKNMVSSEDFNLLLKISSITNNFTYVPEFLCQYLVHDQNTSKKNFDWSISARNAYRKYLYLLDAKSLLVKKIEFLYLKSKYYLLNKKYKNSFKLWIICALKGNFKIKIKSILLIAMYFFKKM